MTDIELLNNIFNHDQDFYTEHMSTETKDRVVKDGLVKMLDEVIEKLNTEIKDVRFSYRWGFNSYRVTQNGHPISSFTYNKDYNDHDHPEYFEEFKDMIDETNIEALYQADLESVMIQLDYFWERKCSLGCNHKMHKFYIMNMPKLLNILACYRSGFSVTKLIQEYIPDFFYDLEKKPKTRGRPKKNPS